MTTGGQPTSRSRLLLDQRTPAEREWDEKKRKQRRRSLGVVCGTFLLLVIVGGVVFYLFFYDEIIGGEDNPWSLNSIILPDGFRIEQYVRRNELNGFAKPRSLHVSQYETSTIVYVGTATAFVYALIDYNSDGLNDALFPIWQSTLSFAAYSIAVNEEQSALYIDDMAGNIWQCRNVHEQVLSFSTPEQRLQNCSIWMHVPYGGFLHNTHYMSINPFDGNLCISFGIPQDIGLPQDHIQGTIRCFDGYNARSINDSTVYARGVRNSVGFEFHPSAAQQLWFTDCGPYFDDELNKLTSVGQHFGFPYCLSQGFGAPQQRNVGETRNVPESTFGPLINDTCYEEEYVPAYQPLGPNVESLGLKFVSMERLIDGFPNRFILIAQHGSTNNPQNQPAIGYRIMMAELFGQGFEQITAHEVFAEGWVDYDTQQVYGRPVDVEWLPHDDSFIVSDDERDIIYRIYYVGDENEK